MDVSGVKRVERERKIVLITPSEKEENTTQGGSSSSSGSSGYSEYMALLSLVLGLCSLLFKHPLFAWQGIFCCVVSLANQRLIDMDYKQVLYSICVSLMGLFMAYKQ